MDLEINFFPKFTYIISTRTVLANKVILIIARNPEEGALENVLFDHNTLKGNFLHFIAWNVTSTTQQIKHPHR